MPSIGDKLAGRYRLDARIGSGGFATVFRAQDLRLGRDVAVKVLLAHHAMDPVFARRFDREARVLAAVNHPNVVAVHDVEPGDPATASEPFLVMDLCDDGSLADRLAASGTGALPPDRLVPILIGVAAGLDALHARGIVHRDLKPSNVLLCDGEARIADLGIAAVGPSELTAAGTTVGTLAYLAPEQLAGHAGSPASDVHALGVIAFLGLTGRLPRPAGSVSQVVAASIRSVDPVSAMAPGLGSAFDWAIGRALEADPIRRPTASEFGAMLSAALERWRAVPVAMVADDATTLTNVRVQRRDVVAVADVSPQHRDGRMVAVTGTILGVLVAALILAVAALLLVGPGGFGGFGGFGARPSPLPAGGGAGASPSILAPSPSPTPSPVPTLTPSPSPSPTPTPTPVPTQTLDPYANARAASDEMQAAVAAARGQGGLNGRDAKDLEGQLARFDHALVELDPGAARDAANTLAGQVTRLVERGAVDAQVAARLQAAADQLVAVAGELPG